MYPGFSSIFIPSRAVREVWRTEGWTLGFISIFIPSLVVCEVGMEADGWTLDFPLYLSLLMFGVKYGGQKGGPWIFLYIYPFSCFG